MTDNIERNMGEQPLIGILQAGEYKGHDVVDASDEQITHKMVARACKGRRLTRNVQHKILRAVNKLTGEEHMLRDLFNY